MFSKIEEQFPLINPDRPELFGFLYRFWTLVLIVATPLWADPSCLVDVAYASGKPLHPKTGFNDNRTEPFFKVINQYLQEYAKDNAEIQSWYSWYVEIPVDPLYRVAAEHVNDKMLPLGGSDLVEQSIVGGGTGPVPKLASPSEINAVRPIEYFGAFVDSVHDVPNFMLSVDKFKVPGFAFGKPFFKESEGKRPATVRGLDINIEAGHDLQTIIENTKAKRYLIEGQSTINIPAKTSSILVVPADAKVPARLYFRTPKDYIDWNQRILTLPDSHCYPENWVEQFKDNKAFLSNGTFYCLMIYARAKTRDSRWTWEAKSKSIIDGWIRALGPDEAQAIADKLKVKGPEQAADPEVLKNVLGEFNLK